MLQTLWGKWIPSSNSAYEGSLDQTKIEKISNLSEKKWQNIQHFFFDPFDSNHKNKTANLLTAKSVLDEANIDFWLSSGTLLGAYRENDYIKGDHDIELDTYEETLLTNYDMLYGRFISLGFIVRGHKRTNGAKINLYRDKGKISIRGLFLDPDYEQNKFRLTRCYRYPRKFFEAPETIEFKGATFRVPSPIEDYIVYVYGENWRTPISHKQYMEDSRKRGVLDYKKR
jgi:hypothetical protein